MTTTKKTFGTLAVLAAVLTAGVGFYAFTQDLSQSDVKALDGIRASYMQAMNSVADAKSSAVDDFMSRYVDPSDFKATLHTGQVVTNVAEFKSYIETMKTLLGVTGAAPQGRYEIKDMKPQARIVVGDTLFSAGTAEEFVQAVSVDKATGKRGLGQPLSYSTLWAAVLKKDSAGHWKLSRANVKVVGGVDASKIAELRKLAAASMPKLATSDN